MLQVFFKFNYADMFLIRLLRCRLEFVTSNQKYFLYKVYILRLNYLIVYKNNFTNYKCCISIESVHILYYLYFIL